MYFSSFAQTADVTQGCVPLEVQFTAPSGATSFFWDFKDAATSAQANPSHIFTTDGTFVVEFRESAAGPLIGTITITVFPEPELNILANPDGGCVPLNVNFQSISTIHPQINVQNFNWTFGDGTGDNGPNPMHTYTNDGSFTVSLAIETNFSTCNVTEVFADFVTATQLPNVSFTTNPDPPLACDPPLNVTFTNTTTNAADHTFNWVFGNGNTSMAQDPPAQDYNTVGDFTVTLTATDSVGCSNSVSQPVSVGSPTAAFTMPDTVCVGQTVEIENNSSAGNYQWTFGAGIIPSTSTAPNPTILFTQIGTYNISLTVTSADGMCTDMVSQTVVANILDPTFTATPTYSCEEPFIVSFTPNSTIGTSWLWDFGDSTTSIIESPVHTYMNPDTNPYSINDTVLFVVEFTISAPGCELTSTDTIILNQPNARLMPDVAQGCAPLDVVFSDSSYSMENIVEWEWVFGDGTSATATNGDPQAHTYMNSGQYDAFLVITNAAGCKDTSYTVIIEVGDTAMFDFSVDKDTICPDEAVTLTGISSNGNIDEWHFETDNNRSFHCFSDSVLTHVFQSEIGPQSVTLTVGHNGCYSTLTKDSLITVRGPIARLDYAIECGDPYTVHFRDSSYGSTDQVWIIEGIPVSTNKDYTHTFTETGDYTVVLGAANNDSLCPPSLDTAIICIRDVKAVIEIDAFSSEVDTVGPNELCASEYTLSAGSSVDVYADCWKGHTWDVSFFSTPCYYTRYFSSCYCSGRITYYNIGSC